MNRIINITNILGLAIVLTFAACFPKKGKGDQLFEGLQKALVAFIDKIDSSKQPEIQGLTIIKKSIADYAKSMNEANDDQMLKQRANSIYNELDEQETTMLANIANTGIKSDAPEHKALIKEYTKTKTELNKLANK